MSEIGRDSPRFKDAFHNYPEAKRGDRLAPVELSRISRLLSYVSTCPQIEQTLSMS